LKRAVLLLFPLFFSCAVHGQVTVFAAASLKNALDEVSPIYEKEAGGRARISYAASSALARQIENGAPADVFLSADREWMDYLERKALLVPGTRRDLLGNRLVLIAPASRPARVQPEPGFPLRNALGGNRLAMGDPQHVPAGRYAKAALENLGVWAQVRSQVAPMDNVRAALALVARGETPLGIVYATDAKAERAVTVAGVFPADSHPSIVYPVAVVKGAKNEGAAFAAFLAGPQARRVFEKHGFTVN
jgi:molybdate transport system substrate-binding protein